MQAQEETEHDRNREGQGDVKKSQAEKKKEEYSPPGGRMGVDRVGKTLWKRLCPLSDAQHLLL